MSIFEYELQTIMESQTNSIVKPVNSPKLKLFLRNWNSFCVSPCGGKTMGVKFGTRQPFHMVIQDTTTQSLNKEIGSFQEKTLFMACANDFSWGVITGKSDFVYYFKQETPTQKITLQKLNLKLVVGQEKCVTVFRHLAIFSGDQGCFQILNQKTMQFACLPVQTSLVEILHLEVFALPNGKVFLLSSGQGTDCSHSEVYDITELYRENSKWSEEQETRLDNPQEISKNSNLEKNTSDGLFRNETESTDKETVIPSSMPVPNNSEIQNSLFEKKMKGINNIVTENNINSFLIKNKQKSLRSYQNKIDSLKRKYNLKKQECKMWKQKYEELRDSVCQSASIISFHNDTQGSSSQVNLESELQLKFEDLNLEPKGKQFLKR
jgi:hypothetical protein